MIGQDKEKDQGKVKGKGKDKTRTRQEQEWSKNSAREGNDKQDETRRDETR